MLDTYLSAKKESVYIVKQGDNLSAIAERFGVPLLSLIIWNRLDVNRAIHPGQELVIHQEGVQGEEGENQEGPNRAPSYN